jgi:hypothetical protein
MEERENGWQRGVVGLQQRIMEKQFNNEPPLASEKILTERKRFFLDLKENQRGRFLKITEDVGGRRDNLMLPMEAAQEFLEAFTRLVEFEATLPPAGEQDKGIS